ncbi:MULTISPECIES: DUF6252 family protein [Flavobacterium]|uniref:DUF6252 family protein n=1 Tax=Flavobacterium TaxID=237 RepID=UPI001FCC98E4|nr:MULTISPECIES: DUF6252 family protein [Flavobacterium]UOK43472.1 DUF6252 family protein [Flavobacterium enshiense]
MKKIVSLFVLATAFVSCGEDIQFNSPAVQATKNGAFWKANTMDYFSNAEGLTITASVGTDIITLHTSSAAPGTYVLGENSTNKATYKSVEGEGRLFETGDGIGSGKIVIAPGGGITGKFDFIAEDEEGNEVNFTNGDFYQIPPRQ